MTRLKTAEQYDWAVMRVEQLLPLVQEDTRADDPARIELELLSELVADYSEANFPLVTPSLAEVLKLKMLELDLSQRALADMIGVNHSRLSEYLAGKCQPTLKVARRICVTLHIDPAVVLGV